MRVRRDQSVVLTERVGAVARPGVRARMRGESRAYRVLLQTVCGLLLSDCHARADQQASTREAAQETLYKNRVCLTSIGSLVEFESRSAPRPGQNWALLAAEGAARLTG